MSSAVSKQQVRQNENEQSKNLTRKKALTMKKELGCSKPYSRIELSSSSMLLMLAVLVVSVYTTQAQSFRETAEFHMRNNKMAPTDLEKLIHGQLMHQKMRAAKSHQVVMQQQQHQQRKQAAGGAPKPTNAEYEQLKRDALIDTFKAKLLKLLEIDEAPNAAEVDISRAHIPEPIMREYEKLMHEKSGSATVKPKGQNRKSRDVLMHQNGVDLEDLNQEDEIEEDNIRFNGSVVQQVTLLPRKCNWFNILTRTPCFLTVIRFN
jgi:hypothetical protein